MQKDYLSNLKSIYKDFYSDDGKCPYYEMCSKNIPATKYAFDYSTKVGTEYGKHNLPKVLFIGQEGTQMHNEFSLPVDSLVNVSKYHYPRTLWSLTKIYTGENVDISELNQEKYLKYLKTLALTNYYKCAFFKEATTNIERDSGLYHTAAMKKNCYKLLINEIKSLEPDLIVVQGRFTNRYFWNEMDNCFGDGKELYISEDKKTELYEQRKNGKSIYILYSFHPAARGNSWIKHQSDLENAIDKFREVYNNRL